MINIQTQGNGVAIEVEGTGVEITAEVAGAVLGVYKSLREDSEFAASMFIRQLITELNREWMEIAKKNPIMCKLIDTASLAAECKKEQEDIRSADFDSDEQFKEWFRGGDE